ncbi:hypothetical protein [Streptomyces sp. BK79]|uniref:hypothetical protein n=1 Tax=Streptomyces sp. BK79 TaxID=3350097 RepID=UPI00376FE76E
MSKLAALRSAAFEVPADRHVEVTVVSNACPPMVSRRTRELGRPVRILKILGLRSDEGADRNKRPAFRTASRPAGHGRSPRTSRPVVQRTAAGRRPPLRCAP